MSNPINRQRSKSKQRISQQRQQKPQQNPMNQNRKYEMANFQRGPSNQRRPQQRAPSNQPEFPSPQIFPQPGQVNQFIKSSSPNRMMQSQQNYSQPFMNIQKQNIYQNPNNRSSPNSFKQMNFNKIQTIEELASVLRNAKKPFHSTQAISLQTVLQRISPKYHFEQIYQVFVYFFIHSSSLDQSLYKVFYSLVQTNTMTQSMNPDYLQRFYETLIRATLKSSFEEYKGRIEKIELTKPQEYFKISHQLREKIVNRSLYQINEAIFGCSIRNTLTLIRKVMQREKNNDKNADSIHPIRQILKVLKNITKSILKRIFLQPLAQNLKQTQEQKDRQNTFHLILISELSLILHFKYKHHIGAEFEETLNEMTLLKMNLTQIEEKLRLVSGRGSSMDKSKSFQNVNINNSKETEDEVMLKNLKLTYENAKKEHYKNYLYLLFVLNISSYYSTDAEQSDMTLFGFYLEPLIQEYRKSSEFLEQKILQISEKQDKDNKASFYLSIIKNFGIVEEESEISLKQPSLFKFIKESQRNALLKSIQYFCEYVTIKSSSQGEKGQKRDNFIKVFNVLSPVETNFDKINKLAIRKAHIQQFRRGYMQEMQQNSTVGNGQINHVEKEFSYLIDNQVTLMSQKIREDKKQMINLTKKIFKSRIKLEFPKQTTVSNKEQKVVEVDKEIPNEDKTNEKHLDYFQQWLTNLTAFLTQQTSAKMLGLVYLLYKFKKIDFINKSLLKVNHLISELNSTDTPKADTIIPEENEQANVGALSINFSQQLAKTVSKLNQLKQTQLTILKLIQNEISHLMNNRLNLQLLTKLLQTILHTTKKPQHFNSLPSSIVSVISYELLSQEEQQSTIINSLIRKIEQNQFVNPQTLLSSSKIIEEKDENIEQQKGDNSMADQRSKVNDDRDIESVENKIFNLISNIKKYIELKLNNDFKQNNLSVIQKKLTLKKLTLLRQQILTQQLPQIITHISLIASKNQSTSSSSSKHQVYLESIIQELTLKLFKLYQSYLVSDSSHHLSLSQDNNNQHNQNKQTHFQRQSLAQSLGITLFDKEKLNRPNQQQSQKLFQQHTNQLLSEILSSIYFSFTKRSSPLSLINCLQKKEEPENFSQINLEQILILKLKKCISLFYDKINDNMIMNFIFQRNLFILRCLTISFYKIKSLSDIFVTKFGVFNQINHNKGEQSQIIEFFEKVFFNVKDQKLLKPYVTFLINKDKFYLKTQLIQLTNENQNNSQLLQLMKLL